MTTQKIGTGQTVLVTGASAGIGVDLAECFAKDGYDLILSARGESALREVATRLSGSYGVKTSVFALDLGDRGAGTRLAASITAAGWPSTTLPRPSSCLFQRPCGKKPATPA